MRQFRGERQAKALEIFSPKDRFWLRLRVLQLGRLRLLKTCRSSMFLFFPKLLWLEFGIALDAGFLQRGLYWFGCWQCQAGSGCQCAPLPEQQHHVKKKAARWAPIKSQGKAKLPYRQRQGASVISDAYPWHDILTTMTIQHRVAGETKQCVCV